MCLFNLTLGRSVDLSQMFTENTYFENLYDLFLRADSLELYNFTQSCHVVLHRLNACRSIGFLGFLN